MRYESLAVNPRKKGGRKRKKGGKKRKKGGGKKRKGGRKRKKGGKAIKRGGKKRAYKKGGKRRKSGRRKPKRNPAATRWVLRAGAWYLMKGARTLGGPYSSEEQSKISAEAKRKGITSAEVVYRRKKKKPTAIAKRAKTEVREAKAAAAAVVPEVRDLSAVVSRLLKQRKSDQAALKTAESALRSCKARLGRARKRGDLSGVQEGRLRDRLEHCEKALAVARASAARKRPAAGRRRAPAVYMPGPPPAPWPRNVPTPTMSVGQAVRRLSKAGQLMRHGKTASAQRMQLASRGYLALNPMEAIGGHPGMFAQFKSAQARRARAVATRVPPSVKPTGRKPVKKMSEREKKMLTRRLMRI